MNGQIALIGFEVLRMKYFRGFVSEKNRLLLPAVV
jgi:hypothetical protein